MCEMRKKLILTWLDCSCQDSQCLKLKCIYISLLEYILYVFQIIPAPILYKLNVDKVPDSMPLHIHQESITIPRILHKSRNMKLKDRQSNTIIAPLPNYFKETLGKLGITYEQPEMLGLTLSETHEWKHLNSWKIIFKNRIFSKTETVVCSYLTWGLPTQIACIRSDLIIILLLKSTVINWLNL